MNKPKIGITIGDINGIGPEIIIKTFSEAKMLELCTPIVYGSSKVMAYHKNIAEEPNFAFTSISDASRASRSKLSVLNCWEETANIELGNATSDGGKFAHIAMDRVMRDAKEGKLDAIVTAPINKEAMQMANFEHKGHTEFFTKEFEVSNSLMTMVAENLRVALVTNHIPISEVPAQVTKENIKKKLKLFHNSLVQDFGIEKPVIAILGLNPHAGDGGVIGTEDDTIIRPIIIEAKKKAGMFVKGPYAADGFFGSNNYSKVDGILAMYHDQGLVPFKALSFGSGVNFTAGLPIIRTSPDHGTGFDIVGKNKADESSFRAAVYAAIDLSRNKKAYKEDRANKLQAQDKKDS